MYPKQVNPASKTSPRAIKLLKFLLIIYYYCFEGLVDPLIAVHYCLMF
jgi:hypothetical protein